MPWTAADSSSKTKKANTPKKKEVWEKVANERLSATGDDATAIREANAVIDRMPKYGSSKKK